MAGSGRVLTDGTILPGPGAAPVFFPAGTPESDLPAWAQGRIGDHLWTAAEQPTPPAVPVPGEGAGGDGPGEPTEPVIVGQAPPRHGTGSSKAHWVAFAEANGLDVGDDDTREDIIEACAAAGLVAPA